MKNKAIICDLDGTLYDSSWRQWLLAISKDTFMSAHVCDKVKKPTLDILNMYISKGYDIIFITGRTLKHMETTIEQLRKTGFKNFYLYMKPNKDERKDAEFKKDVYNKNIKNTFNIELVLEDRTSVVQMWRSIGLTCFQVAEGDF